MADDTRRPEPGIPLATAIARMPIEAPERSAWPALAERIDALRDRPRSPRWPFLLAAAAAAVLALVLVLPRGTGESPAATPNRRVEAPAQAPTLDALMGESARLEALLANVSRDETNSASALLLGLELEDRIARLDEALATPGLDQAERTELWRQRVAALRDYAGLQGTAQWVAVQGGRLDGALVATF